MTGDLTKHCLQDELHWVRASLLSRLDGLSEYDVRRPLTRTGTNLLGLVKHLSITEARYLGDIFGRPYDRPLPNFNDPDYAGRDQLWVRADESRSDVVRGYRRACAHADATIAALPIDAPGRVPWWPRPDVQLVNVMVHVLTETNRHAGHADILHEELASAGPAHDDEEWAAHRALVEAAAAMFRPTSA